MEDVIHPGNVFLDLLRANEPGAAYVVFKANNISVCELGQYLINKPIPEIEVGAGTYGRITAYQLFGAHNPLVGIAVKQFLGETEESRREAATEEWNNVRALQLRLWAIAFSAMIDAARNLNANSFDQLRALAQEHFSEVPIPVAFGGGKCGENWYMIMEYIVDSDNLNGFIEDYHQDVNFFVDNMRYTFEALQKSLLYLTKRGGLVSHGDLHAGNVLVRLENGYYKPYIIDFGRAIVDGAPRPTITAGSTMENVIFDFISCLLSCFDMLIRVNHNKGHLYYEGHKEMPFSLLIIILSHINIDFATYFFFLLESANADPGAPPMSLMDVQLAVDAATHPIEMGIDREILDMFGEIASKALYDLSKAVFINEPATQTLGIEAVLTLLVHMTAGKIAHLVADNGYITGPYYALLSHIPIPVSQVQDRNGKVYYINTLMGAYARINKIRLD